MTFRIHSSGHPYIPAGVAETPEEALLAFVQNSDDKKVAVREIFNRTLGEDLESYLERNTGMKTFSELEKSGNYGPLHLDSDRPFTYESSMGTVTRGPGTIGQIVKGLGPVKKVFPPKP